MTQEPPYLHLYAQKYQHADAEIIGNRQALMNLWDALHDALDGMDGRSCQIEVFTNDGEGYSLSVRCVESNFQELPLPYTEKWEQELP